MQSQLRPQAPPQSWQQHSHAYPQPQQKVAMLHGMQPQLPQNVGRPGMPNQGVQPQPFPQSQAGLSGAVQLRPMHLGPNQPSANQTLGQHLEQSAHSQPGLNVKQTTFEKPDDDLSNKGVGGQEGESFSEKTAREDANGVAATSGIESNTVEIKSETDMKSMDEKQKTTGEDEDTISRINNSAKEIPESMRALGSDPMQQASEDGEPVIKQMVKEEVIKSTVERSPGGKSIGIVVEDQKDELSVPPKQVEQVEHSLLQDKEIQNGLLMKNPPIQQVEILDEMGGKLQKDSGDASGVMQLFTATNRGTEAVPPAPIPDSSAQNATPRGSVSVSERKMLNQPGARQGLCAPSSSSANFGWGKASATTNAIWSHCPAKAAAPSSGQAMPPPGLVHNAPVPGGILGPGSAASFGRGLSHFAPPQRSFEPPSVVSQGHYNQGHGLPSHAGPSRISQGELFGRPPLGPLPAGSFDSHGGMMVRAPPHGPEGQQRPVNPVESEIFSNPRPNYFDGRQSDSHIPGSSERGPFGQPSGIQSNMMRMNGGLGIESSLPVGLQDERFKSLPEPGRRSSDHGKFAEDLKQFSRGSQGFVMDAAQGLLDKAPLGFNYDSGFKSSAGTGTSRFFPPPHPGGDGERSRAVGFHEDNVGRSDMAPQPESSLAFPHRGFGGLSGVPGRQSDLDDIDGRESRRFGEGSKTFNLPLMKVGFQFCPATCVERGEHFGSRNIPGQLRFGEPVFDAFLGHPRMGELSGPGNFPSRLSAGESFGGSNKSGHPRIGEPGFRSTYSLHGYPNDHGFRPPGDMESFDNSRKRKPLSMAWCRICNIDCETVDGLDMHSQTREHQQMAMDIVLSIKQQNAKKQKLTSKDHSTPEDSSKSKKGVLRGGGISIKP
ncbi:hypothetical protein CK203_007566 [Vitis vinifera]|uniref:Uncharacterized protein n=1 Tax=Vitis vinifera TaxID=29760 RepID=A0A438G186_VITVI|nr:hypothetical protein CK203_007566 [Vitis vinifera]